MSATRPPVAGDVGARRYGGAVVSDAQMYAHLAETSRAEQLPPTVDVGFETTILDYMKMRQAAVVHNWYARVPISKYPEDLRTYEYLLWLSRANVVIEIGSYHGGSALWFRDQLRTMSHYHDLGPLRVISIDVDQTCPRANLSAADPSYAELIELIEHDITDPALPDQVEALVPEGARCLVIEDSAHVYETTIAALRGFHRFVPDEGFFVVEDGHVDIEELRPGQGWPRGVLPAIAEFVESEQGRAFTLRRDLELYGVTAAPMGFLQRTGASS